MHNYFVCYVVFLIYIVLVNGECTRDTTISNAEDCGFVELFYEENKSTANQWHRNLCSIQDGIDDCLNRCPTDDNFVMCNIQLSSTPTGVFSGVGNASTSKCLRIFVIDNWLIFYRYYYWIWFSS